jgi:NAD(P)-dependent dehydrogenase (short-subunit alcohol dehydrogenase family)
MAWTLDGRTALITGAASGIGAALARTLSARGMRVGLIDVDTERLEAVAASVPGAVIATADVRDREALTAAIERLVDRLGGLDVAVASAGIATAGPARMVAPATVEDTIDINLLGVWRTASAALPALLERRGYLLLVSSAAAIAPFAGGAAYSAAKAGVEGLGRSLRMELATHGVGVGVAYYLFLDTPMVTNAERVAAFRDSKARFPNPISRTYPLEPAIAATVAGIERRSRTIVYPRFLRGMMALRGLLLDSGLADRLQTRGMPRMEAAFALEVERVGPDAAARAPRRED